MLNLTLFAAVSPEVEQVTNWHQLAITQAAFRPE